MSNKTEKYRPFVDCFQLSSAHVVLLCCADIGPTIFDMVRVSELFNLFELHFVIYVNRSLTITITSQAPPYINFFQQMLLMDFFLISKLRIRLATLKLPHLQGSTARAQSTVTPPQWVIIPAFIAGMSINFQTIIQIMFSSIRFF